MKVSIQDTRTGVVREIDTTFDATWWVEGNGACDCNRRGLAFPEVAPAVPGGRCEGADRFRVVAVEDPDGYTLGELNRDYADESHQDHDAV